MTRSSSKSVFDEDRWIVQIRQTLEEELEEDCEIPVSIFCVPKTLMACHPDSYTPQAVAIGPYHHWRLELYDMERYKLAAAKNIQKQLRNHKFQHLVDQLSRFENRIRAVYHKYLDFNGETLVWMMAVDASFLLEFLYIYAVKEGKALLSQVSSRMSHLVDVAGKKSAHNAILRDMVMLENQIPLFLFRKMLEFQHSSLEVADNLLLSMLIGFCKELSPFNMTEELPKAAQVTDSAHLLDFLYRVILPELEKTFSEIITETDEHDGDEVKEEGNCSLRGFCDQVRKSSSKLNKDIVGLINRIVYSRPIKAILKIPWTIISNLPPFIIFKQPVEEYFCFHDYKKEENQQTENLANNIILKPPLMEEITIPSVTELSKAGVQFLPTNEGIFSVTFDSKNAAFSLPIVSLDMNTEVVLRNLVAYEACNASGPLVFTRYTELMNGIIDTEEDAKLLREKGIILNRMKSDKEVANLWNGMSRSVRLTKVPFLDQVIEDVNNYYNGKWSVRIGSFMKLHVFSSWQCLTLLAAIMLLFLMTLQAFCTVYGCNRGRSLHVRRQV